MISSFGESGFSVFHAGHCDWQRPHSVHVRRSRLPFHVKSLDRAAAEDRVVVGVLEVDAARCREYIGSSGPRPLGRRENSTLNGARKMCMCLL